MILITIVKDDPTALTATYTSIKQAVVLGLPLEKWLIKLSGPKDSSLQGIDVLPEYCEFNNEEDAGIYDAMNQAVDTLVNQNPKSWTCLLNAGDQLHETFASWYNLRDICREERYSVLIGRAVTDDGFVIDPDSLIIGKGGLNFCHQAALFRLEALRTPPFPTQFRIAGDYAHFLSLKKVQYKFIDVTVCQYDMTGVSERSVIATRIDNFRAGYEARGIIEVANVALMFTVRAARKFGRMLSSCGKPPKINGVQK